MICFACPIAFDTPDSFRASGRAVVPDDLRLIEHDDLVAIAERGEAVRDDDRRLALDDFGHVVLDDHLAFRIERAGRLVEQQDRGAPHQGAGDGQALLLPAREVDATLFQEGVVALRQPLDELLGSGLAGGPDHLVEGGAGFSGRHIVADRPAKQKAVLQHDAHMAAQVHLVQFPDLVVVDADQAALGGIEALHQPHQRALARAAATHDPDDLPDVDREADPVERRDR
jgi:hypothetical protein